MRVTSIIKAVTGMVVKIVVSVAVVMLIYKGAVIGYEFGYRVFDQQPMTVGAGREITVTITEEMSGKDISELFYERGLVENKLLFIAQYYLSEFQQDVKPGTYVLNTSMTVEEMMEIMAPKNLEEET